MTGEVVTTIYLSGQMRRPADSEFKWPEPTFTCAWCGEQRVSKSILPEGWFALGDGKNIRYGCHYCKESEIPRDR